MSTLRFYVQGSAPEPYEVLIERISSEKIKVSCDCPAGMFNTHCKHRVSILKGDYKAVVSDKDQANEFTTLESWIPGSNIENVLNQMDELESEIKAKQTELRNVKKKLARIMS